MCLVVRLLPVCIVPELFVKYSYIVLNGVYHIEFDKAMRFHA